MTTPQKAAEYLAKVLNGEHPISEADTVFGLDDFESAEFVYIDGDDNNAVYLVTVQEAQITVPGQNGRHVDPEPPELP